MLRVPLLAFLFVLGSPAVWAEDAQDPCEADLASLNTEFDETLQRLDTAWKSEDDAQKCEAIKHHIDVMRRAAEVFDVCTSGHARDENMGQAIGTIADFEDISAEIGCP